MAKQQFNVSVEVCDEFCIAFAFDWPATCGWGPSLDAALDRLGRDVAFMSSWLAARGFDVPTAPAAAETVILECLPATGDPAVECDTEGFYAWDAKPYTDAELAQTAMMLGFSRAELLSTIAGLSDAALDLRLVEGKRTVREIINHIAIAEWWYTTRIMAEPSQAKLARLRPRRTRAACRRARYVSARGPLTLEWLQRFLERATAVGIDEIGVTEHLYRFAGPPDHGGGAAGRQRVSYQLADRCLRDR